MKIKILVILIFSLTLAFAQKIAVLDFKPLGYFDAQEIKVLSERFRNEIVKTGKFEVMERQVIDALDQEIARQLSDGFDKNRVAEFGKKRGAAYIVIGNIGKIGKRYTIDIKMINCTTTHIEKSFTEDYKGDMEGLIDVMHSIAFEMAGIKEKKGTWKWITSGVITVGGIVAYLILSAEAEETGLPMPPNPPN